MIRPWNKQRRITGMAKHRRAVYTRYTKENIFQGDTPLYLSVNSRMGYEMARGIYWQKRYHPAPTFESQEDWAKWNLQGEV